GADVRGIAARRNPLGRSFAPGQLQGEAKRRAARPLHKQALAIRIAPAAPHFSHGDHVETYERLLRPVVLQDTVQGRLETEAEWAVGRGRLVLVERGAGLDKSRQAQTDLLNRYVLDPKREGCRPDVLFTKDAAFAGHGSARGQVEPGHALDQPGT